MLVRRCVGVVVIVIAVVVAGIALVSETAAATLHVILPMSPTVLVLAAAVGVSLGGGIATVKS